MNLPLLVAVLLQETVVKIDDTVMELTSSCDSGEINVLAWDGTSNWLTLWDIAITLGDDTTEQILK